MLSPLQKLRNSHRRSLNQMRLAACVEPQEVLRPAPISALCQPQADAEWTGFWALDGERYFARLRYPNGDSRRFEQWFVLVDSVPAAGDGRDPEEAFPPQSSASTAARAAADGVPPVTVAPGHPASRRPAIATRVVLRRSTVRPSIDGPAVRRTAAVMVRHRRGDTPR